MTPQENSSQKRTRTQLSYFNVCTTRPDNSTLYSLSHTLLQHNQNTQGNVMFSVSVTSKRYTIKFRSTQDWRIQRHRMNTQSVSGFATIPKCIPAHKMCSVQCEALDLHTTLMNPSGWRSASSHHHRRRQRRDGRVCVCGGEGHTKRNSLQP